MSRLSVEGLEKTMARLKRLGEKAPKHSWDAVIDKYAPRILTEAKALAPIDKGKLENAIVRFKDEFDSNNRKVAVIGVDENELGPGFTRSDFRYDIWAHEIMTFDQLGEKSIEKAKANGKKVGPKYLERAAQSFEGEINAKLEHLMKLEARKR